MLDYEQKQKYGMQHSEHKWHSENGYYYGNEAPQMQPCLPPPPPPQARHPKMYKPAGYPQQNNSWSYPGQHSSGGEMWHANGGRPYAEKFPQCYGGGYNAGGMMVEEVMEEEEEEESFHEMRTRPSGVKMQEMHYEHDDWTNHGVSMGPGPGYRRVMMNGKPRAEWVSKGL